MGAQSFSCAAGVKQADPASPDLFGMFVEILTDYIDAMDRHDMPVTCPHTGAVLQPCTHDTPTLDGLHGGPGPSCVPSLVFADDANLLALSAEHMNYLLALLDISCGAFGMKVNVCVNVVAGLPPNRGGSGGSCC